MPALPAEVQAAAERAAAIISEFEHVFSSAALLQTIGRQQTAGSEVSRQLFQGAAAAIRSHYGLPSSASGSGGSSLHALLALAGGSLGTRCCRQALQRLADELVQCLLPVLARAPQGLPAELAPDVPVAPQPSSIIVHCRRFGSSDGCLARFAPGVSGGPLLQTAVLPCACVCAGRSQLRAPQHHKPLDRLSQLLPRSARLVRRRHRAWPHLRQPFKGWLPLPALLRCGTAPGEGQWLGAEA